MSSARLGPIWCSARSENRWPSWLRRAATAVLPVLSTGVWQRAHPMFVNTRRPLAIDTDPPGVSDDGVGGARKRMKKANFSRALLVSRPVAAVVFVTSLGT